MKVTKEKATEIAARARKPYIHAPLDQGAIEGMGTIESPDEKAAKTSGRIAGRATASQIQTLAARGYDAEQVHRWTRYRAGQELARLGLPKDGVADIFTRALVRCRHCRCELEWRAMHAHLRDVHNIIAENTWEGIRDHLGQRAKPGVTTALKARRKREEKQATRKRRRGKRARRRSAAAKHNKRVGAGKRK